MGSQSHNLTGRHRLALWSFMKFNHDTFRKVIDDKTRRIMESSIKYKRLQLTQAYQMSQSSKAIDSFINGAPIGDREIEIIWKELSKYQ